MSWSNAYIGIPFRDLGRDRDGADCWGLACIIYREELGIRLPDYLDYGSAAEHREIAALVAGATTSPLWHPVWAARPFDIAVFRRGPLSRHVGIVVTPGVMIHMAAAGQSRIEDWRSGAWRHRLQDIYRYRPMAVERPVSALAGDGL